MARRLRSDNRNGVGIGLPLGISTMRLRGHNSKLIWLLALLAGTAVAQGGKAPSVTFAPVGLVTAPRAAQTDGEFELSGRARIPHQLQPPKVGVPDSYEL